MKLALPIFYHLSFEQFQDISGLIFDQHGAAQSVYGFSNRLTPFEAMLSNELFELLTL